MSQDSLRVGDLSQGGHPVSSQSCCSERADAVARIVCGFVLATFLLGCCVSGAISVQTMGAIGMAVTVSVVGLISIVLISVNFYRICRKQESTEGSDTAPSSRAIDPSSSASKNVILPFVKDTSSPEQGEGESLATTQGSMTSLTNGSTTSSSDSSLPSAFGLYRPLPRSRSVGSLPSNSDPKAPSKN
jgi:hypothetical protein